MEVTGQLQIPAALHQGKNSGTHCISDWVDPRASMVVFGGEKKSLSCAVIRTPVRSDRSQVTISTMPSRLHLLLLVIAVSSGSSSGGGGSNSSM